MMDGIGSGINNLGYRVCRVWLTAWGSGLRGKGVRFPFFF
jgi:hypothetical protein